MESLSRGLRVEIYCGEADQVQHKPRYAAILEYLRKEGAAGATVTRGIAGFGRQSVTHTAAILDLSLDLPVVITWIDAPERVRRLLPGVRELAGSGIITVAEVGIASYGERTVGKLRFDLHVADVMTTPVRSVGVDAAVREAVETLLDQPFRALPVVDDSGKVAGLLTNGDLVAGAGLGARIELLNAMDEAERGRVLDSLPDGKVRDAMNDAPTTIRSDETLAAATILMGERGLKRLPVVDGNGSLVGMLSRADILRAVAEAFPRDEAELATAPGTPRVAREVMRADYPVVRDDAGLPAVIDAICSTRLNRAVVVDSAGRVVGVVSDSAVVKALGPAARGIVAMLMSKVKLGDAPDRPARELMVTPAGNVGPDAPLSEVARVMTEHHRKIVPVTNAAGRLLGIIDRADLLAATHAALAGLATPSDSDEDD